MKRINILLSLISILTLILTLTSCTNNPNNLTEDKLFCNLDNDCVCGGIDKETNNCFLGNKDYFEKNVDKTKDCPDFCTGIANMFETKCVQNKCQQVKKQQTNPQATETKIQSCQSDVDCIKAGCSNTLCIAKSNQESGFTTCEWKDSYKCYQEQSCICQNNKCNWNNQDKLTQCINSY